MMMLYGMVTNRCGLQGRTPVPLAFPRLVLPRHHRRHNLNLRLHHHHLHHHPYHHHHHPYYRSGRSKNIHHQSPTQLAHKGSAVCNTNLEDESFAVTAKKSPNLVAYGFPKDRVSRVRIVDPLSSSWQSSCYSPITFSPPTHPTRQAGEILVFCQHPVIDVFHLQRKSWLMGWPNPIRRVRRRCWAPSAETRSHQRRFQSNGLFVTSGWQSFLYAINNNLDEILLLSLVNQENAQILF